MNQSKTTTELYIKSLEKINEQKLEKINEQKKDCIEDVKKFCKTSAVELFNGVTFDGDSIPITLTRHEIMCRLEVLKFLMSLSDTEKEV